MEIKKAWQWFALAAAALAFLYGLGIIGGR
jgi:hypothetical protein